MKERRRGEFYLRNAHHSPLKSLNPFFSLFLSNAGKHLIESEGTENDLESVGGGRGEVAKSICASLAAALEVCLVDSPLWCHYVLPAYSKCAK